MALVAERDGLLVGFVVVGAPRDDVPAGTGEVLAIYVAEDHWGTDVGHRLMTAARARLADGGYDRFYLWVLEENPCCCMRRTGAAGINC